MSDLVLIGAGDYHRNLVEPCISALQRLKIIGDYITIDTIAHNNSHGRSILRDPNVPLSKIVDNLGINHPYVILSHPNQLHTPDAVELMTNSKSSPKLLIEKPYATNQTQQDELTKLLTQHPGNIGLLEYYLTMKAAPLLLFGGVINQDSLYFQDNGILRCLQAGAKLSDYSGLLEEKIGRPISIITDVLEGEGNVGTVEHRNLSLIDNRFGGGMIQDLGHHALSPLMALEEIVGKITPKSVRKVRTAFCREYMNNAKSKGLSRKFIGESYAEINLETSTGVQVYANVGKYVQNGTNQRRIVISGTRGILMYDMTKNQITFSSGEQIDNIASLVEAPKSSEKYLAVIMAGMEYLEGRNPFTFNPIDVALNAQGVVLKALEIDQASEKKIWEREFYKRGTMHDQIFQRR